MSASSTPTVACFGEALWDILPRGIFLGGAPLNVAYHLSRQGVRALPITALGRDFLGDEARRRMADWGLDLRAVARLPHGATGTVRATLDAKGTATYRIARHVAWDRIPLPPRSVAPPAAIVFGSLALREPANRQTLQQLFRRWPRALRVLDLNLRAPFDRGPGIRLAIKSAQLVKLNEEELARMTGRSIRRAADRPRAARQFAEAHQLTRVCVTAGGEGAGLWWDGQWHWQRGRKVRVRDTVGAGDAFLGALLAARLIRGAGPRQALAQASALGNFIAARDGATPPYRCDSAGKPRDEEP